jgi:hypothetical protein
VTDVVRVFSNASWVTRRVADSEGKKADEGTMMLRPAPQSNPATAAEPLQTRTLTPATTKEASDILMNGKV